MLSSDWLFSLRVQNAPLYHLVSVLSAVTKELAVKIVRTKVVVLIPPSVKRFFVFIKKIKTSAISVLFVNV